MNCDDIHQMLGDAYVCLHRNGHHLMAHALRELVSPMMEEREQAAYNWVLATTFAPSTGNYTH